MPKASGPAFHKARQRPRVVALMAVAMVNPHLIKANQSGTFIYDKLTYVLQMLRCTLSLCALRFFA